MQPACAPQSAPHLLLLEKVHLLGGQAKKGVALQQLLRALVGVVTGHDDQGEAVAAAALMRLVLQRQDALCIDLQGQRPTVAGTCLQVPCPLFRAAACQCCTCEQ